jgi:hypothetical protein
MYRVEPKVLSMYELTARAAKHRRWEIMFVVWTVHAALSSALPTPVIHVSFASNRRGT